MPTLELTDEQALALVQQLPPEQQAQLLEYLLLRQSVAWLQLSQQGQAAVRAVAARRGRKWDQLNESAREQFIDDLVHEDR